MGPRINKGSLKIFSLEYNHSFQHIYELDASVVVELSL